MKTSDFDYHLPPEQIAQEPVEPRDAARLLVLNRADGRIAHRRFREIGAYLNPGDVLVFNQTRVIPARLHGRKRPTGGRVELLLLRREGERTWRGIVGGRGVREGVRLVFEGRDGICLEGIVVGVGERAERIVQFDAPLAPLLDALGETPLPPYIHRPLDDPERYQTVYAREPGSAAAPTAGLHFTPGLLADLRRAGIRFAYCTLHIGLDTFQPVTEIHVEEHAMHRERVMLSAEDAAVINDARRAGGRIVAVGTTSVRVLETAALRCADVGDPYSPPPQPSPVQRVQERTGDGGIESVGAHHDAPLRIARLDALPRLAGEGAPPQAAREGVSVTAIDEETALFIRPGYRFRAVDALITNFHLPRSTLIMLVAAFAGREMILNAYAVAQREGYRFYSFGDVMVIL